VRSTDGHGFTAAGKKLRCAGKGLSIFLNITVQVCGRTRLLAAG
jgi:hypothetical protein